MIHKWDVKPEEHYLLVSIVRRAQAMAAQDRKAYSFLDLLMDLTACHVNGTPLALQKLLDADDGNFAHDVFGIHRFIDRETGHLTQCFMPRYAKVNHQ